VDAVLPADPRAIRAAFDATGCGDVEVHPRRRDPAETWRRRIGAPSRGLARDARPGARRGAVLVTRGPDDRYVALLYFGAAGGGAAMGVRPAGIP
jgi:hypothetical protein